MRLLPSLLLLCLVAPLHADERILAYDAEIDVATDGTVTVRETIRVRAEGNAIRRGIYRDFPTRYQTPRGNRVRVDFEVLDVRRDGAPEPWHTEGRSNGVRVYAGSRDVILPPGEYTYEIRYRTNRQLGFFDDFDELYWNVTGNGWAFPIDQASARVKLPRDLPEAELELNSYTGAFGERGQPARAFVEAGRGILFEAPGALAPREGLTISVTFPKGVVMEPTDAQRLGWFFRDNGGALVLLLSALLVLGWYLWAWNRTGRDPARGVIIPRYAPPEGLSPAACRYVRDMRMSQACFTAAVVSLGVKGHLVIEEDDGDFTLHGVERTDATPQAPSPGERAVMDALMPGGGGSIELDQDNHRDFRTALSGLGKALAGEYKGRLFNLNTLYAVPAFVITAVGTGLAIILKQQNPAIWFAWALGAIGLHLLFILLLRAPTVIGQRIRDEIDGFALYLETAEQDRLDRMQSPELTPELFETFLPYAFALGVENAWVERFEREFPRDEAEGGGYHPAWYHGNLARTSSLHHIGNQLGSDLSGAISSASTPPGSSSGSGGGGFSGGGGGGGGGGGW
ncbi:MAG: DUF2207 domain-containing protein [Xanthomonadales bacterium]|nr:DUF2207 domain-containing protein [Xanthomonadales bacterium]